MPGNPPPSEQRYQPSPDYQPPPEQRYQPSPDYQPPPEQRYQPSPDYQPPPEQRYQPSLRERMVSLASSLTSLTGGDQSSSEALAQGSLTAPTEHPEAPDRAIGIIAELKGSASLFAAFAFGALNLPSTLMISESRVTSATSSVSTSRPVPDSDLLQAFVVLDAATFGFMLICVVVSQQLLYRLGDGTYGSTRFGTDEAPDPRDSTLGRLTTQYGFEFRMARIAFGLGLIAILLATVVKTWAVFDSSIALPVTGVIGLSSAAMAVSYVRVNGAFRRLGEDPAQDVSPAALIAAAAGVLVVSFATLGLRPQGSPGVTAERAFQNVTGRTSNRETRPSAEALC